MAIDKQKHLGTLALKLLKNQEDLKKTEKPKNSGITPSKHHQQKVVTLKVVEELSHLTNGDGMGTHSK